MSPKRSSGSYEVSTGDELDGDTSCGIGSWRPQWLQVLASPKYFVVNFTIVSILQGAYFTYLIGSLSTLEKRYAFESKISGFIMIADNLSQMVISPIVGYLGAKYNRSVMIAIGELIVALSCFISAIPYFIYGPGVHLLSEANVVSNLTHYEVCSSGLLNTTGSEADKCGDGDDHSTVFLAVALLWFASFANGVGYTAFYTIGLPYIDDNVQKKNSPIYISSITTLRLIGPSAGFMLCSVCLAWYEDPFYDPQIDRQDPRWIGAWWIGFIILGVAILVFTIPMFMFPREFKKASKVTRQRKASTVSVERITYGQNEMEASKSQVKLSTAKEVKIALKRLARNPILILHSVGGVFRVLGYLGHALFKPKYMEMQFRQSASSASAITGSTGIVAMACGIMAGGLLIRRFKPRPRLLVSYMFIVDLVGCFSLLVAMFIKCPTPNFANTEMFNGRMVLDAANQCNSGCDCTTRVYQPVCSSDGMSTYFSPCYAGCKTIDRTTNPITFNDCQCIGGLALNGYCPTDCNKIFVYIIALMTGGIIASTARTGNTLITLRCVDPKDKSFAMGIIGTLFALFGKTGNCWLYDIDKFRVILHGASFAFITFGTLLDIGIVIMADRIQNLYDDDEQDDDNECDDHAHNSVKLLEKPNEFHKEDEHDHLQNSDAH